MRNLLFFMLFVAVFVLGSRNYCSGFHFGFGGVSGKGSPTTETRSVSGFHGIELDISGDVEVTVGENYAVEISAQPNLLPILRTEVHNGSLRIYSDESFNSYEPIKVRVTAPAFDKFSIGGSGAIRVLNALRADKMEMSIGGSGDIFCSQSEFGSLSVDISGSGGAELGGKANDVRVAVSGSGDVHAKQMSANTLEASISGSGTVSMDVTTSLQADVSGSGEVFYSGSPSVESSVSGSGTVKKISVQ